MSSGNRPQPLGEIMQELIDEMGLKPRIDGARVVEAWAFVAGTKINSLTQKAWFRSGKLYVKISSATWRHELHLRRREWLRRLNKELGEEIVEEIVFR